MEFLKSITYHLGITLQTSLIGRTVERHWATLNQPRLNHDNDVITRRLRIRTTKQQFPLPSLLHLALPTLTFEERQRCVSE